MKTAQQCIHDVTEQIATAEILCPLCTDETPAMEQTLFPVGDAEHTLKCPHCDLEITLSIATQYVFITEKLDGYRA